MTMNWGMTSCLDPRSCKAILVLNHNSQRGRAQGWCASLRPPNPAPLSTSLLVQFHVGPEQNGKAVRVPGLWGSLRVAESVNDASAGARTRQPHPRPAPESACQTLVSGYNQQLPPAARVLSKAQLREIKFMGVI